MENRQTIKLYLKLFEENFTKMNGYYKKLCAYLLIHDEFEIDVSDETSLIELFAFYC